MRNVLSILVATLASLVVVSRPVEATPIALALVDSSGNFSGLIVDQSAGDLDPTDGVVSYSGVIGDWSVNLSSGIGAVPGTMQLTSFNLSGRTTSTLIVGFTQLDNALITAYQTSFLVVVQNGSAAYGAFADPSNAGFGTAATIGFMGPFAGGATPQFFSGDQTGLGPLSGPYSLTQLFVFTGNGEGETGFAAQADLHPVPEPISLVLVGSGMLAAGWRARRRLDQR